MAERPPSVADVPSRTQAESGGRQINQSKPQDSLLAELLAYSVVGYGIVVFVLWIVQSFNSGTLSIYAMLKSTIHLLLLPSLILLPLCLLLRKWRLSLILVPAVIAFVISYGVFFLPRGNGAALESGNAVQVLTFNLQAPERDEVDALVEIIRNVDADVVAVQELSFATADRFAVDLDTPYPHQALHPQEYPNAGQGVLSRYPIVADRYWRYDEDRTSLGHQRVVLEIEGTETVFYNTHPIPPYAPEPGYQGTQHTAALLDILARANRETGPTVILGDLNMTDQFQEYRRIADDYTDAYKAVGDVGFGFTFPHDKWTGIPPLIRLDYIFYSPEWTGITAGVWPGSGSSDHAPVWAQLALSGRAPQPASFLRVAHSPVE